MTDSLMNYSSTGDLHFELFISPKGHMSNGGISGYVGLLKGAMAV